MLYNGDAVRKVMFLSNDGESKVWYGDQSMARYGVVFVNDKIADEEFPFNVVSLDPSANSLDVDDLVTCMN